MAKSSFGSLFNEGESLSGFTFNNEAMVAAVKKAQEAKTVRAAEQSATLLGHLDKHNSSLLTNLRNIRKLEKTAKDKLESFKEAAQYFLDSGNFGPLYKFVPCEVQAICQQLSVDLPTEEEQKIPAK